MPALENAGFARVFCGAGSRVSVKLSVNRRWFRLSATIRQKFTTIGAEVSAVLRTLPQTGYLFPTLADISPSYRGHAFVYRLKQLGITGLTLHSYRYAWAERAKAAGYPERFAMQALGHKSEAVHRAYAKQAEVVLPPLEEYELPKRSAPAQLSVLLPEASRN